MRSLCVLTFLIATTCWRAASATCDGPPRPDVAKAFTSASAVFLGNVEGVRLDPADRDPNLQNVTEIVTMRVLVAWKGDARPGDVIELRTPIGPDACGDSAQNNPPWVKDLEERTVKLSGIWIVYAQGGPPFALYTDTRSMPLESGASDLDVLYRLSKPLARRRAGVE